MHVCIRKVTVHWDTPVEHKRAYDERDFESLEEALEYMAKPEEKGHNFQIRIDGRDIVHFHGHGTVYEIKEKT